MIITTGSPFNTSSGDGAKGKSCAIDMRVASSIPAEQLPIFPQCFFSSYKTSKLCVQTALLLPLTSSPWFLPSQLWALMKTNASKSSIDGLTLLQKHQMLEIMLLLLLMSPERDVAYSILLNILIVNVCRPTYKLIDRPNRSS